MTAVDRSSLASLAHGRAGQAAEPPETGPFHGLFQKHDTLERMIADAGPLGKFTTDQPDQMPSGTSALTIRVGDTLNRIAAQLGMPNERILSSNSVFTPPVQLHAVVAELPPGQGPTAAAAGERIQDPRPAIAIDTGMTAGARDHGNGSAIRA